MVKGGLPERMMPIGQPLGVKELTGHTAGLFNLGNTCYMNPQQYNACMSVPELKSALVRYCAKSIRNYGQLHNGVYMQAGC
ncbi:hypothetical protein NC652_000005 [Populus alba x Populus x berolinensis]|nr:hypothetical protein NC652_000005 [Populus alba x Populus x berolinensis]